MSDDICRRVAKMTSIFGSNVQGNVELYNRLRDVLLEYESILDDIESYGKRERIEALAHMVNHARLKAYRILDGEM